MLGSIIRSHCNKNFVLGSAAADAGRAGLAGFLDAPHLDACSSMHSDFHRCRCLLPNEKKLNFCMLANVQNVPSFSCHFAFQHRKAQSHTLGYLVTFSLIRL